MTLILLILLVVILFGGGGYYGYRGGYGGGFGAPSLVWVLGVLLIVYLLFGSGLTFR